MIDKLIKRIDHLNSPTVVGLDTTYAMIPDRIKDEMNGQYGNSATSFAQMLLKYNKEIIDHINDLTPAVKIQIAMYEYYGPEGLKAYCDTAKYARDNGLIVIGDIKRGDIGSTAQAYASHLAGFGTESGLFDPWQSDAITLNPYMGHDGIKPFINVCREKNKSCFILVKTSNTGSSDIQDLMLKSDGEQGERTVYEHVADLVSQWGLDTIGSSGYSKVGAVVGATHREQGKKLRERMPHTFFLVPGYGAQGADGKDLEGFFDKDGRGCIVNSSRGIIANWLRDEKYSEHNIGDAARDALMNMNEDLRRAI